MRSWELILCPYCKIKLPCIKKITTIESIYKCTKCETRFKRMYARNSIGLIKHDSLYEIDDDGYPLRAWD